MQQRKKSALDQFEDFQKSLKSKPSMIYYLTGEEVFFHDRAIEQLIQLIPSDMRDFNLDMVNGNDSNVSQVLTLCKSYPMMTDKRMVIVREFQSLAKSGASSDSSGSLNDMIPFVEKPNPGCICVFLDEKPVAKNTKLGKILQSSPNVTSFEFAAIPDYTIPEWISNWAQKEHKVQFEPFASQLLVQLAGNDLLVLSNEIEKLAIAKAKDNLVTDKDVRELVGLSKEFTVFELKDAIIQRRVNDALSIADSMLSQGDSPTGEVLKSLGFFNAMFVNIWQYLRLQSKGISMDEIANQLNINGFRLTMLQKEARLFTLQSLPVIFEILYDADRAMKGFSTLDERSIFFMTIQRLCSF